MDAMAPEAGLSGAKPPRNARRRNIAYWQAAPFALLFLLFFVVPLVLTVLVSFWTYDEYQITPDLTLQNLSLIHI